MQLRYGLMADYSNVTQDGKLNILGIFDRLFAVQFPALHRELYLVTSLETENEDDNSTHEMHVQLIDPDGKPITELRGQLHVGVGKQVLNQIHVFQDLQFSSAGNYQFNIFLNGKVIKSIDLELAYLPQQMQQR